MSDRKQSQVRIFFTLALVVLLLIGLVVLIPQFNVIPEDISVAEQSGTTSSVCQTGETFNKLSFDEYKPTYTGSLGNPYTSKGVTFSENTIVWNSDDGSTNGKSVFEDPNSVTTSPPSSICANSSCGVGEITLTFSKPVNYFEVYELSGPSADKIAAGSKVTLSGEGWQEELKLSSAQDFYKFSKRREGITKAVLNNAGGTSESWDDVVFCTASTSGGGGGGGGTSNDVGCGPKDSTGPAGKPDGKIDLYDLSAFASLYKTANCKLPTT